MLKSDTDKAAKILILAILTTAITASLPSSRAASCGVPLTIGQIQSGIMPSDDNLPCQSRPADRTRDPAVDEGLRELQRTHDRIEELFRASNERDRQARVKREAEEAEEDAKYAALREKELQRIRETRQKEAKEKQKAVTAPSPPSHFPQLPQGTQARQTAGPPGASGCNLALGVKNGCDDGKRPAVSPSHPTENRALGAAKDLLGALSGLADESPPRAAASPPVSPPGARAQPTPTISRSPEPAVQPSPIESAPLQPNPLVASAPPTIRSPNGNPRGGSSGASLPLETPNATSTDGLCYGGPLAPPGGGPNDCKAHWQGTNDPADCARANDVERSSAYWGFMCVPETPKQAADRKDGRYYNKSPVKPEELSRRAELACPLGQNMNLRQQYRCLESFKFGVLLREEPAVQAECNSVSNTGAHDDTLSLQEVCAHVVYTYGPGSNKNLNLLLMASLGGRNPFPGTPWHPDPEPQKAVDGCPIGQGLQPDRSAFGAWTCQSLTFGDWGSPGRFENRVNELAAIAAAGAEKSFGPKLSQSDQERCAKESYSAVRALFKRGATPVSRECREMAFSAVHDVPYLAADPIMTSNRGVDEVLAGYRFASGNLGVPLPGMTGLEPSAEERRQADCIAGSKTREECMQPPQSSPAPTTVTTSNCASAETHWRSAEKMKAISLYEDHLARFPDCAFATLARARIEAMKK